MKDVEQFLCIDLLTTETYSVPCQEPGTPGTRNIKSHIITVGFSLSVLCGNVSAPAFLPSDSCVYTIQYDKQSTEYSTSNRSNSSS